MSRRMLALPKGRSGVAWRFPRRDGFERLRTESHSHDALEAVLVMHGSCDYEVHGVRMKLPAHSLLWLPAELEHAILGHTPDFSMWLLCFSTEMFERIKPRVPIEPGEVPREGLMRVLPPRCVKMLDNVAQELSTGFQPLDCGAYGFAWWLTSAWNAFLYGDGKDAKALHPGVSRAMSLLLADPSRDLTALAIAICFSPSQLSRLFKRQVGVRISDFRNDVRLETFLKLRPKRRRKSLLAVATEAGFGSYAQFNRVFHRELGCTAEEYYLLQNARQTTPKTLMYSSPAKAQPSARRSSRRGAKAMQL